MTNVWKLLRLTTLFEFLPVLLVSLMALFTGLALLGASAWLVASAALMPPLYTLALGITTVRACGIGRAVFRYGERYLSHRMAFRILTEIRLAFYDAAARCLPLRSGPARQGEFLQDYVTCEAWMKRGSTDAEMHNLIGRWVVDAMRQSSPSRLSKYGDGEILEVVERQCQAQPAKTLTVVTFLAGLRLPE